MRSAQEDLGTAPVISVTGRHVSINVIARMESIIRYLPPKIVFGFRVV